MYSKPHLCLLIVILATITTQGARPESQQKSGKHVFAKRGECFFTCIYDHLMF